MSEILRDYLSQPSASPYIVTTKRRPPAAAYVRGLGVRPRADVLSRRAVATLDEARAMAGRLWHEHGGASVVPFRITEPGGTATLPDGKVIDVEATKYKRLRASLDAEARRHVDHAPNPEAWKQRTLDAYNARQESA